ncbi:hypothetical protein [Brevibacterium litoralis]|uniref:hypothetical protein n=1 Tax=Brevibacterium litoralis TaxID=3138935 RepID=UPI0032F051C9
MVPLIEVEAGTVVADRYVVSGVLRPWLADHPDVGVVILAIDAILDAPVVLYAAHTDASGDLLDVGRRSALLTDPRIPAIRDVGSTADLDFVVCARTGTTSLTELLREGPLPAESARALAGEVATALTHASRRGLHHLCLGPESIGLTSEGEVVVHGLGIDAAVAAGPYGLDLDSMSTKDAEHADALAVVDVLYAALTAHWPGDSSRAGLPLAPKHNARFEPVSAITTGVPRRLEEFVSGVVTGTESGPRGASEIVRYLGDWDTATLVGLVREDAPSDDRLFPGDTGPVLTGAAPSDPVSPTRTVLPGTPAADTDTAGDRATQDQLQRALRRIGFVRPGTHGQAAGRADEAPEQFDDLMRMRAASAFPIPADRLDAAAEDAEEWDPETARAEYARYSRQETDPNLTAPIMDRSEIEDPADEELDDERVEDTAAVDTVALPVVTAEDLDSSDDLDAGSPDRPTPPSEPAPGVLPAAGPAPGSAAAGGTVPGTRPSTGQGDDSWFMGGMFTTDEERLAAQQAEFERERELQRRAAERAALAASAAGASNAGTGDDRPTPVSAAAADGTATSAPAGTREDRERSRKPLVLLIGLLAAVLVVALVVWGIARPRGEEPVPVAEEPTSAEPAPETAEATPTPTPTPTPTYVDPVVVAAEDLDPEGDGSENPEDIDKVMPGVKGAWQSERYNSSVFGYLKKGLGIGVTLESPESTVAGVELVSGTPGGELEIRMSDSPEVEDAEVVATGELPDDRGTIAFDEPVTGEYLFVWFTKLPPDGQGYVSRVSEIRPIGVTEMEEISAGSDSTDD